MDARVLRVLILAAFPALLGAGYPTKNFIIEAPTPEIAKQVGQAAEFYRKELAIEWLGRELPPWSSPCPVKVRVGQIGASGETRFSFFPDSTGPASVGSWDMRVNGPLERILDSVLPHEISHTIFACYFRRPLPRWADEGAATLAEVESERRRQVMTVNQVLKTGRRISFKNLLNIKEYPRDPQDVFTLYAEGYVLADLLIQEGGRKRYLNFLTDAHRTGWDKAIEKHYGYHGIDALEKRWHSWVVAGCPDIKLPDGQMLADKGKSPTKENTEGLIIRGQSPPSDLFPKEQIESSGAGSPRPQDQHGHATEVATISPPRPLPLARKKTPVDESKRERETINDRNPKEAHPDVADRATGNDVDSGDEADYAQGIPMRRSRTPNSIEGRVPRPLAMKSAGGRNVASRSPGPARNSHSELPDDPRPSPWSKSSEQ